MAKKYYTITDGFFREEYPMKTNIDVEKLYSTQRIIQKTTMFDFLGSNLATYLLETILPKDVGDMEEWETDFLLSVQNMMVFWIAKEMEDFNSDASDDNRVNAIRHKISYYAKRTRTLIADTSELVTIQDTDTEPDNDSYQGFSTWFYR